MKTLRNWFYIFVAFVICGQALADSNKDYYSNYYGADGGALLFKIRGSYLDTGANLNKLPAPTRRGATKPSSFVEGGYGVDSSVTIFVSDHFASEVSLGVGLYKSKASAMTQASAAYGTPNSVASNKSQIFSVPLTVTGQYHIAPFGGIRPYVGAGYSGAYMYSRSHALKVHSGAGPVFQAGVDFTCKDDTLFTLDVKKYILRSKITLKNSFLNPNSSAPRPGVSGKVNWDPLVISAGIGFKF